MAHSPTLPLLHLRDNSFSQPSLVSPTSQALHLIHLASRPRKCTPDDNSPGLRRTRVRSSVAYIQNLLSSLKTTERHSTLRSSLSRPQSSHTWRCHDISGNLARGTRDLSHPANRQFPMVLGDTAGATCARISSRNAATAARNNVSTLTCVCTTWPSRTWSTRVGMFYRHC